MSAVKMNWREFMNFDSPNKYIYICMHTSAVKISSLTHAMNFSSLMAIKIFNGGYLAGLGLASPFTTTAFVSFSWQKMRLFRRAECLYDHIKWEIIQTSTPLHQVWVKRAWKRYRWRGASAEQHWTAVSMSVNTDFPLLSAVILCL